MRAEKGLANPALNQTIQSGGKMTRQEFERIIFLSMVSGVVTLGVNVLSGLIRELRE